MPFPLAHPAAVLPLRRFCPKYLSFPALVIGSLAPDAAYLGGAFALDTFSHRLWGGALFSVPVGLLALGLLYGLWPPKVRLLPEQWKRRLLPQGLPPLGSPLAVVLSLVLGAWTHVIWDSLTHKSGWLVGHWPALLTPVMVLAGYKVRIVYLLWYASSFVGVIFVYLAYTRRQAPAGDGPSVGIARRFLEALIFALLVVPIELVHHLVRGILGACIVAAASLLLVAAAAARARPKERLKAAA